MKKKNKFPLLNFEAIIDNDLLLNGEKLYDEGKLQDLIQLEKGKWSAHINDGETHDCFANLLKDQIENYHCTCSFFSKEKDICQHLVCLLFGIRHSDQVVKKVVKPRKTRNTKSNLTLKTLFDLVEKEDLSKFILSYSGKDKRFKLLLKTHFARQISEKSGKGIYSQILDDAFPVISQKTSQYRTKNQQLLVAIAKEMLVHNKDAISLEQFTDSFHILEALSSKLAYAIHVSEKATAPVAELNIKTHIAFEALFDPMIAPGLKQEINDSLLGIIDKTFYNYFGESNFYELLFKNKLDNEQKVMFIRIIREKIISADAFNIKVRLLSYYIKAREIYGLDSENNIWLAEQLKDPFILLETFNYALKSGYVKAAEMLLENLQDGNVIEEKSYYKLLLKIKLAKNDKKGSLDLAHTLFEINHDFQYLKQIKTLSGNSWKKHYLKIISNLKKKNTNASRAVLLNLCAKEKDQKNLIEILKKKNDLELFLKYDHLLVPEYKDELVEYYEGYLLDFNKDHAGLKAVNKTIIVLEHLDSIGLKSDVVILSSNIKKQYPQRKSLQQFFR